MLGHRVLALVLLLSQLGPLQWQKEVSGRRHGPSAHSSCLSNSHHSSFAHRAPLSNNQRHPAPHVSLSHRQLLPCLTSCGPAQKPVAYPMALQDMTTLMTFSAMRSLNESIGEAEDSGRLESVKRELQGVLQLAAKTKRRIAGKT